MNDTPDPDPAAAPAVRAAIPAPDAIAASAAYPLEPPPAEEPATGERPARAAPAAVLRPREKMTRFGARGMSHAESSSI